MSPLSSSSSRLDSALLDAPLPTDAPAAALKELRLLLGEIERTRLELHRSNKRLAREVSAWVGEAMQAGQKSVAAEALHQADDLE